MPRGISNRWTWQLLHNNYCFICNNAIDIWNNFIFLCFLQHSQPQICTISIFFIWKHTPVNNYLVTTSKSQNVKITEIDTILRRDIYLYFLRKEAFILLTKIFLKLAFWIHFFKTLRKSILFYLIFSNCCAFILGCLYSIEKWSNYLSNSKVQFKSLL